MVSITGSLDADGGPALQRVLDDVTANERDWAQPALLGQQLQRGGHHRHGVVADPLEVVRAVAQAAPCQHSADSSATAWRWLLSKSAYL